MQQSLCKKKYDYILCDSHSALDYFYKKGLNKKIPVITSSPKILSIKKINSINLYKNWNTNKFKRFQKSILGFTLKVFKELDRSKYFSREEALLTAIHANRFNNFLLKVSQLQKSLKYKRVLFIKISDDYSNASQINPPWEYVFASNKDFESLGFKPEFKKKIFSKTNFIKRIYFGGFETFAYRIFSFFSKFFYHFFKKRIIIISENELLIEASLNFILKGYAPINISLIKQKKRGTFHNKNKIELTKKLLSSIIQFRVNNNVSNSYKKESINYFFKNLNNIFQDYNYWVSYFNENSSKFILNKNFTYILANHPANAKGLAAKNVFKKKKVNLISFQHGVTAEISASHNYCLSQHDSSASDVYYAFNKQAVSVARKNPFNISSHKIYGMPKRYKRQEKKFGIHKKYSILFLSNRLHRGNDGGISVWVNDFEFSQLEISLIKKVFSKVNKTIFYKPYPASFDRYLENDPVLEEIYKYKNLKIIYNKQDARYLTGNSKLLICCIASSTLSWAIMSKTPVVFINFENIAPLRKDAIEIFNKGLFLFNYDDKHSMQNLKKLLSLPYSHINELWKQKVFHRKKLIQNYISSDI